MLEMKSKELTCNNFNFEFVYPTVSRAHTARAPLEQALLAFNRTRINPDFGYKFAVVTVTNGNCAGQLGVVGQAVVLRLTARRRHDSASDAGVLRREHVTREIIIIFARRVAAIASRSIIGKRNIGGNVV